LRDRKEDLGLLVAKLLAEMTPELMTFSPEAARALFTHSWPENIRELKRRLTMAVVLAKNGHIERSHMFGPNHDTCSGTSAPSRRPQTLPPVSRATLAQLEPEDVARREQIVHLLKEHRGNVTAVANALGKARVQVQRWIRRYGVDRRAPT
jgi:DNA-binding NtrC family response regulator